MNAFPVSRTAGSRMECHLVNLDAGDGGIIGMCAKQLSSYHTTGSAQQKTLRAQPYPRLSSPHRIG